MIDFFFFERQGVQIHRFSGSVIPGKKRDIFSAFTLEVQTKSLYADVKRPAESNGVFIVT